MTQTEYMLLQHRLSDKLRINQYSGAGRTANIRRAEGFEEGIKTAKSILHGFYQQFGEDTQEVDQ